MNDEPREPRWSDDPEVDPALRSFVADLRADVPDAAHVEHLVTSTRQRAAAGPRPFPTKLVRTTLVLALASFGVWRAVSGTSGATPTAPHAPESHAPQSDAPASQATESSASPPAIASSSTPEATRTAIDQPLARLPRAPEASPASDATADARARPHARPRGIDPVTRPPERAIDAEAESARRAAPEPLTLGSAPASTSAPVLAPAAPSPADELALLREARRALRSDPRRAGVLVQEHAARFPTSAYAEERAVLRFDVLLRSGHRAEAQAEATRILERWPASIHRRHIEESLAAM